MFFGSWQGGQCHVQTPDLSQAQRGVGDRGGGPVHPPAPVYGALAKLMRLEHPLCGTRAEKLRLASEEEMADMLTRACPDAKEHCSGTSICRACWLDWLLDPADNKFEREED